MASESKAGDTVAPDAVPSGDTTVAIHPLTVINITDHATRARMDMPGGPAAKPPRVIGMVFGKQSGLKVEIYSSHEAMFTEVDGAAVLDLEHFKTNIELYTQVFPDHEMLGWYSTGTAVSPADLQIHKQVCGFNENPLYLFLDVSTMRPEQKHLPLHVFSTETHIVDGTAHLTFVKQNVSLESFEMERITVDHVMSLTPEDDDSSSLNRHLTKTCSAVGTLKERISVLRAFLEATKAGRIPTDHALLRQISSICNRLPAISSDKFRSEFLSEFNDTLLLAYLATVTKGAQAVSSLVDKFQIAYERRRRGAYGM